MINRVQNKLFYLLVFLLPINLGKHFIVAESYVKSHLIDYLIPTIWLTDILLLVLIVLWLLSGGFKKILGFENSKPVLLFLTVLLPSVAIAPRIVPSLYVFGSLFLHVLFMFYVALSIDVKRDFKRMVSFISVSIILLSLLALVQWLKQGAAFDNYLFFGEQPYDIFTKNIALINLFGFLKVPVYGLFRHPNIFGGFLAVSLLWIYVLLLLGNKSPLFKLAFSLGFFSLVFTFSDVAMLALLLGMIFLLLIKNYGRRGVFISMFVTFSIFFASLFLPILSKTGWLQDDPSIYRRSNLQKSTYMMLEENALFGVGLGNFTVREEDYLPRSQVLRFIQPVHNTFLLMFAEGGIFALIGLFAVLMLALVTLLNQGFGIPAGLFVTLLQFFIIGSFDHYLITIQQMQLLFWLTVGLALTYTRGDVEV